MKEELQEYKYDSQYRRAAHRNRELYLKHREIGYKLKQEVYNLKKELARAELKAELAFDIAKRWNNYGLDAKGKIRTNGEIGATCGPKGFNYE